MRKLSKEGKSGTPDQVAAGIGEGDIERSYMKLPKANLCRPAVPDLLAALCEQHSAEQSITVIAAGLTYSLSVSLWSTVKYRDMLVSMTHCAACTKRPTLQNSMLLAKHQQHCCSVS